MKALPALLTVDDAAEMLSIEVSDVLQLIQDDVLESYRLNGQIRISEKDCLEYLRAIGRTDGKEIVSQKNLPLISTKFPVVTQWLKTRYAISGYVTDRPRRVDVLGRRCYGELLPNFAVLAEVWFRVECPLVVLNDPHVTAEMVDKAGGKLVQYEIKIKDTIYPPGLDPRERHEFIEAVKSIPDKPNGNGNRPAPAPTRRY